MRRPELRVDWANTTLDPADDAHGITVADARQRARETACSPRGGRCLCCGQEVKVYRRTITPAMALALVQMYRYFRDQEWRPEWIHVARHLASLPVNPAVHASWAGGDWAKLRYWQLIELKPGQRDDGSSRMGFARIRGAGRAFVEGTVSVPRYAFVYAQVLLGVDGPPITLADALGRRFSFTDLMRPPGAPPPTGETS